jgi:hypothetical protein
MANIENLRVPSALTGFVKIWQVDPCSGDSLLLVDKQNMILKGGATLISRSLGGDPAAKIWGMYIGYNNNATFIKPDIDIDYSHRFTNYEAPYGYLREPLTFSPNFLSSSGYVNNTVLFSTMITSANKAGGAEFTEDSKIYEVALVATQDVNDPTKDTVFSRTNFNPVQYNSSYNFTITWGVRILLT